MRVRGVMLAALATLLGAGCAAIVPQPPKPEPVNRVVYLDQGWTDQQRQFYYYTPQGTVTMPVKWFMALEQPLSQELLSSSEYLGRFRFLVDDLKADGKLNPNKLPVGWALFQDDSISEQYVGFTCAACHTGQINYKGTAVRIDGGAAMHDVTTLRTVLAESILLTYLADDKFERFAKRLLGDRYPEGKELVRKQLKYYADAALAAVETNKRMNLYPTPEGFARNDALGRIGNTVFADDLLEVKNNRPANAPVSYPPVWDIWYFDWVQYNASVRQPMVRNVGEALGVHALTNFVNPFGQPNPPNLRWQSSVRVEDIHAIEKQLESLRPPAWPEAVLGTIDRGKAAQGRALFGELCASCHEVKPIANTKPQEWHTPVIPLATIGTDPTEVNNFNTTKLDGSKLGVSGPVTPAAGLKLVTEKIKDQAYDNLKLTEAQRKVLDGWGRANEVRETCGYKARPLHGIWSTAPFLHNGSVPNLYELLGPGEARSKTFAMGTLEFDPVKVGYRTEPFEHAFIFDTSLTGNSNRGHEFSNTPGPGVIGRALSDDERWALIEYLKAIPGEPYPVAAPVKGPVKVCGPA